MNMNKILLLTFTLVMSCGAAGGTVRLPAVISSGMVVQREKPLTLWGTADPGEKVTVRIQGKKGTETVANPDGSWEVSLPALRTGRKYTITVNDLTLENVAVGDVLLCSGQSNMELPVSRVMDMWADTVLAYSNPDIRQFTVPKEVEFGAARSDVDHSARWKSVDEDAMNFSALAYFTARDLNAATGLPVGVINASWGGTPVESWISDSAIAPFAYYANLKSLYADPSYRDAIKAQENRNYAEWNRTVRENDPGLQETPWYSTGLDDSDWAEVDLLDTGWGSDGMNPCNGTHWLRKKVNVDAAHAGQPATLRLGCIVDADSVWVNGRQVGFTSYQYPPRVYPIPAGLLKEGENVITIQVISQNGKPHFVAEKPYCILFGERPYARYGTDMKDGIPLNGTWRYRRGAPMPKGPDMMFYCYLPTVLYNGMIAPVIKYPVSGTVWYQGESNVDRSNQYSALLKTMIENWREASGNPGMPFYIVELADFLHPSDTGGRAAWQKMRDVQRDVCDSVDGAVLIPNSDLGEWNDIHPLDKKTLGSRVAEAIKQSKQ